MPREEIVRLALDALRAHKLRSFLTLLGIIIGVSSLIAVVSVVQGLNQYVSSRVMDFGSTSFSISKYSQGISTLDDFWRESKRKNLTLDDFKAVEEGCKHCELVAAVYNENKTLKHKNKSIENVDLRGVTPAWRSSSGPTWPTSSIPTRTPSARNSSSMARYSPSSGWPSARAVSWARRKTPSCASP
jgi:ABC-type lipoprotein release transport system permease subunit